MKINSISLIEGMSGKLAKKEDVVFSNRFGDIHAWRVKPFEGPFSAEQEKVQDLFSRAQQLASADMADPEKKAMWQAIAKTSKGKWKTARGAAFANHFNELKKADTPQE